MVNLQMVKHSYSKGDDLVFTIGERVFVSYELHKHKKEGTIEFKANEVDETCFCDGEYYGDTLAKNWTIILQDHWADNDNIVETMYYPDEIVEMY